METDRRIRRTQAAINTAFLNLILEKELNKITVKELCEKADINKSTFYLHYRDIYDLAEFFQQSLATKICAIVLEYDIKDLISKAPEIWDRVLHLKLDDGSISLSLHHSTFNYMTEAISNQVLNAIQEKIATSISPQNEEQQYVYRVFTTFIISGFLGTLRTFDPKELHEKHAFQIISTGLENGLKLEY